MQQYATKTRVPSRDASTGAGTGQTPATMQSAVGNEAMLAMMQTRFGTELQMLVTGGRTLASGDKGTEVVQLQRLLGFDACDGQFGPTTERALRLYQGAHGLPETGVVNSATLAKLMSSPPDENSVLFSHQTSGASAGTASQAGKKAGTGASRDMAEEDEDRVLQYKDLFVKAAAPYGFPPAVLAALASRETRGGNALKKDGYSRWDGQGFGLLQVDKNSHTPRGGPYSLEHLQQAAKILNDMLGYVQKKFPEWPSDHQLRAAICAYNSGPGGIRTVNGMDRGTTGSDYSSDVWTRAQYYARFFGA